MRTVQQFMNEKIPQEFHEDFRLEFFRWAANEEPTQETLENVFYSDDVLFRCVDNAQIPCCKRCNKIIFEEYDHYPQDGEWSEEDLEYCGECLFEKYF